VEDEEDEAAEAVSGYKQSVDLSIGGSEAWKRPKLAPINPATEALGQREQNRQARRNAR
jgi:hypothetical protein